MPQGLLGQAIDYTLKRWTALNQFVEDGTLEIDNTQIKEFTPAAWAKAKAGDSLPTQQELP